MDMFLNFADFNIQVINSVTDFVYQTMRQLLKRFDLQILYPNPEATTFYSQNNHTGHLFLFVCKLARAILYKEKPSTLIIGIDLYRKEMTGCRLRCVENRSRQLKSIERREW